MKHAILPVGPQYAGKSTFCKKIISAHPEVVYVSRDEILVELFGTVWLSSYTGEHLVGSVRMWQIVDQHLKVENSKIILDAWNGFAPERQEIVETLRSLGADRVDAWRFITPKDTCFEWSLVRKPLVSGSTAKWTQFCLESRRRDYDHDHELFHSEPFDAGLFNEVVEINPLEPRLLDPLLLQAQPA